LYECKNKSARRGAHLVAIGMPADSASKFYKYIVDEKVDHIDNVVFGVLCLAISVILNKISIQSMTHSI